MKRPKKAQSVFTRIYGDFSAPEMMGLYHDLLEVNRAMRNVNDVTSAEYANNNAAAQRITKAVLKSIRTQDPAFIENLLACFGLLNGGENETQFANEHGIPSRLKRDTLIAYGMTRAIGGKPPTIFDIEVHIAWERCKEKLALGIYPLLEDVKNIHGRKENGPALLESKQAIEKIIREEGLSLCPKPGGRPKSKSDPVREVLDHYHLLYRLSVHDKPETANLRPKVVCSSILYK